MRQTAAEIDSRAGVNRPSYNVTGNLQTHVRRIDLRLALFEPDIPQNTGAVLRLAACFGVAVDLIEPTGFLLDDRRLKRAALDYGPLAALCRHPSWAAFAAFRRPSSRLVLLSTRGSVRIDPI